MEAAGALLTGAFGHGVPLHVLGSIARRLSLSFLSIVSLRGAYVPPSRITHIDLTPVQDSTNADLAYFI
jgi:hypothetical protein